MILLFILPIYDSSLKNDNTTSSKKSSLSIYVAFLSLLKDVNYVELFKSEPVKYHNYKTILVDTLGKLIFNPSITVPMLWYSSVT